VRQPHALGHWTLSIFWKFHIADLSIQLKDNGVFRGAGGERALHYTGDAFSAKSSFPERDFFCEMNDNNMVGLGTEGSQLG